MLSPVSAGEMGRLVRSGFARKLRGTWYSDARTPPHLASAIKVGAKIDCISACGLHGLWAPQTAGLHVTIGVGAPTPSLTGLCVHRVKRKGRLPVATVAEALRSVIRFHDVETAMIVLESAVNMRKIPKHMAIKIIQEHARRDKTLWKYFDPTSQSGSETRVRLFLQRKGVRVRSQVSIAGIGRVDLLVGDSLIIECDSYAHHASASDMHRDRDRDVQARILGFEVIRLSYRHIWSEWGRTQERLMKVIRSRRHRRKRPMKRV